MRFKTVHINTGTFLVGYKLTVAVFFLFVSTAMGQTPGEFEKKYGKPLISYQVSENILMTPEYTTDGPVCLMRLHPRHFSPDINFVSTSLPLKELTTVLNQLIPPRTRGAKKEPFDTGAAGGGVDWKDYAYQNVRFSFVAPFRLKGGRLERSTSSQSNPQTCLRHPSREILRHPMMISLPFTFPGSK